MEEIVDFVMCYNAADIPKKVELVLQNYGSFLDLLEEHECAMRIIIKNECAFAHRHDDSELGVKVQTSGTSDPTYKQAVDNLTIEKAVKEGNLHLLDGRLDEERLQYHQLETEVISQMREDFTICIGAFKYVEIRDRSILQKYLAGERTMQELAADNEYSYDGIRNRVLKGRSALSARMLHVLGQKYIAS